MAVIHDLICSECGIVVMDVSSDSIGTKCLDCRRGTYEIYYGNWGKRNATPLGLDCSVTVYKHPQTGKIIYPGRNDTPMPERYRAAGFQRVDMRSMRDIDRFSKQQGVVNEATNYDRGSGRSYDTEPGRR